MDCHLLVMIIFGFICFLKNVQFLSTPACLFNQKLSKKDLKLCFVKCRSLYLHRSFSDIKHYSRIMMLRMLNRIHFLAINF